MSALVLVLVARANDEGAGAAAQDSNGAGGPGAFGTGASLLPLGNLQPSYSADDITIETGLGPFTFQRQFSNTRDRFGFRGERGVPFGRAPRLTQDAGAGEMPSILWTHNLYAYAKFIPMRCTGIGSNQECTDPLYVVRDVGGALLTFPVVGCLSNSDCYVRQADGFRGYRLKAFETGFLLFTPSGERHFFESPLDSPELARTYFLTRIETSEQVQEEATYSRQFLQLRYAAPSGCSSFDAAANGVPYLSEVANFTSETSFVGDKLVFEYGDRRRSIGGVGSECVLVRVRAVSMTSDGGWADYEFLSNDAGLLRQAIRSRGARETYSYGDSTVPLWVVERDLGGDAVLAAKQSLSDAGVGISPGFAGFALVDESPEARWAISYSNNNGEPLNKCPPGRVNYACDGVQQKYFTWAPASAAQHIYRGDGSRAQSTIQHRFLTHGGQGTLVTEAAWKCVTGCPPHLGTSEREQEWGLWSGANGEPVTKWVRDTNNNYTIFAYGDGPSGSGDTELIASYYGASSSTGTASALASRFYSYDYSGQDTGHLQRRKVTWAPTVVPGATGDAGVEHFYDSANRLTATVRFGFTQDISGATVLRRIGTFYTYDPGASGQGRLVETRGPCLTTDNVACAEASYPVQTIEYYVSGANAGRLKKESVSASGAT